MRRASFAFLASSIIAKGTAMPESPELSELPSASPLRRLRNSTIDIAKHLDPLVAHLEDTKGWAEITLIFRRGEWVRQRLLRETEVNQ